MAPPKFPSPTSNWHSETYPSISPTRPELSAKGKAVLVTGGGSGIGAETALYFAEAGASRIAILGRREQPLLDTKARIQQKFPGTEVFTASADVTKKAEVDAAFSGFAGVDGKIDVLISNAAVVGSTDSVNDVDPHAFLDAVQQNLGGAMLVAQAFLKHASADAVVVDVNSWAAHIETFPGFAAYCVSKASTCRLWDHFFFSNPGMSVFHIQPGSVKTEMNKSAGGIEKAGFEDNVSLPASFMVWLASPEARFLKGKYLWTNWDVDELKAQSKEIEESTKLNIGLIGWPFQDLGWKFELAKGVA